MREIIVLQRYFIFLFIHDGKFYFGTVIDKPKHPIYKLTHDGYKYKVIFH